METGVQPKKSKIWVQIRDWRSRHFFFLFTSVVPTARCCKHYSTIFCGVSRPHSPVEQMLLVRDRTRLFHISIVLRFSFPRQRQTSVSVFFTYTTLTHRSQDDITANSHTSTTLRRTAKELKMYCERQDADSWY